MIVEGIFIESIPDGWDYAPIGSFCDFAGGTQPPKSTFEDRPKDGYVRLLQIRDFETDEYAVYIPHQKRLRVVDEQDISIARYGASVGRILSGKSGAINVAIMTTFPVEERVSRAFLQYLLQHQDFQQYIRGLGGRAAQAGFNKGEIGKFKFPLPPLEEQRQITLVLSTVQRAIDRQERLIALTTELKKALVHNLFTEGTRGEPRKQTEIGPVPESWTVTTLGELCKKPNGRIQTGPFGSILHKNEYQDIGTPIVNPVHLVDNRIDHTDVPRISGSAAERLERYRVKVNDLLFGRRGDIGRHAIVSETEADWFCGTGCFSVRVSDPRVDGQFLNAFLSKESVIAWLQSHAAGVIMPNLSNKALEGLPICFPDRAEQAAIAAALRCVDAKRLAHARIAAAFTDLLRTLLHQLMTAQVRVHDLHLSAIDELTAEPAR